MVMLHYAPYSCGAVAQLGEHKAGSLGVRGSIPLSSTKKLKGLTNNASLFILLRGIEPKGMREGFPSCFGGHRPDSSAAIGGWPPVEAKRRRFPPQLHQKFTKAVHLDQPFLFLLRGIEPRQFEGRISPCFGGHRPESSAAIGGWPPVEAKRVSPLSSTKNFKGLA